MAIDNVMDQLMIKAYRRHIIDTALDSLIENAYDFFEIDEPAGRDAGFRIDFKNEEDIVDIFDTMVDQINKINLDDAAKYFEKIKNNPLIKI